MTMDEFSHIAASLRSVTNYLYFHVMGEPLTHPLLPDFIRHATSLGFKCAVTTNGTLLAKAGKALIDSGVYKVNVSVHSFEEGEDEQYHRYISDILDFADESSAAGVLTVLRLWNRGHDGGRNDRTLDLVREKFSDGEWREGSRGFRIRHKLHLEWGDRFEWPDVSCDEGDSSVFCYGLSDHFGVLVDGTVIPCCLDREGVINLGNIHESPIEEILASDRAKAIKEGFKRRCAVEELCRKCGYARRF
jgi:radical SAM protein with 4Fe4S-binding SPASM domain